MKPLLRPLLTVVLTLAPLGGLALTPGPEEFRECPRCRQPYREFTIGSGNTLGSRVWTDGWRDAPMLPDVPPVVRCGGCGDPFWRREAKVVPTPPPGRSKDTLEARPEDYRRLLEADGTGSEKEKILRTRLWWRANAERRKAAVPSEVVDWSGPDRGNLERLLELQGERPPVEVLRRVEILRELGRFEESARLLGTLGTNSIPGPYAERLRSLIRERKAGVALVSDGGDPTKQVSGPTNSVKKIRKPAKKSPSRPASRKRSRRP